MRRAFAALLAAALAACTPAPETQPANEAEPAPGRMVAPILTSEQARDWHSFARPTEARVTHIALDLQADFEERRIGGTAALDIERTEGAREIVLDSKGLEIGEITDGDGRPLQWALGQGDEIRGQPLTVSLPQGVERIVVRYRSAPDAAALQWLTPEQTLGGEHPYLFSQGQAILNRTWIPTQDSPGIRQTWEARVVAPAPLKVVMSAENLAPDGEPLRSEPEAPAAAPAADGNQAQAAGPELRAYRFRMERPVAPYLIAIAAGDIAFRELGPRTGVWTEAAMLDRAAEELADTERMVEAAERLYGPYRWGRYDMIVLPPAFPFGGMENPMLTFLTPTMIAGDKSLVSLIAHELAHSWSGNLVTNAAWADFWLNEGFTTYFENRIMEALYGPQRARQEVALGWEDMQSELVGLDPPMTRLHLDLEGRDPDDGMTQIAYEKGATFLRTIERAVGRERFDPYLRSWFDRHAFQPATAELFLDDIRANLLTPEEAQQIGLDRWVYEPGLPENAVRPDPQAFVSVDRATRGYAGGGPVGAVPFRDWTTAERLRFLNNLPRQMSRERLAELDRAFQLSQSGNSEVLFAWLRLAIANRYEPAVPAIERFLTSMGRRKFVAPLFEALQQQGSWGQPIARRIYDRARPGYHSVTTGTVDGMLGRTG